MCAKVTQKLMLLHRQVWCNHTVGPKRKAEDETLQVTVEHAPSLDAEERLHRAFDLVLRVVAGIDETGTSTPVNEATPILEEQRDDSDNDPQ